MQGNSSSQAVISIKGEGAWIDGDDSYLRVELVDQSEVRALGTSGEAVLRVLEPNPWSIRGLSTPLILVEPLDEIRSVIDRSVDSTGSLRAYLCPYRAVGKHLEIDETKRSKFKRVMGLGVQPFVGLFDKEEGLPQQGRARVSKIVGVPLSIPERLSVPETLSLSIESSDPVAVEELPQRLVPAEIDGEIVWEPGRPANWIERPERIARKVYVLETQLHFLETPAPERQQPDAVRVYPYDDQIRRGNAATEEAHNLFPSFLFEVQKVT